MKNVIAYYRVSTISQDTNRQKSEVQSFCKKNDYVIVKEIEENISGLKPWRERGLSEILKTKKNIDGIVVLELSRFGRDAGDVLEGINQLHQNKVWLHSINQNLKTLNEKLEEDISSKLLLTILSGVSEMEVNITKQRSISGLIKKVSDGNWTGGSNLPYGYKRINKRLDIDEKESEIVKEIFKLYLEGNGTKRIANYLNKQKVPTRYNLLNHKVKQLDKWNNKDEVSYKNGKDYKWADGTIYSILTNSVYIGKKEGKGHLKGILLQSPKIIEEKSFEKVQQLLKTKQKKVSTKYIYILEGKPICGVCESGYFPHKRSNNKDNTYKCLSVRYGNNCGNFGIGIPKLNAGVWKVIRYNREELNRVLDINKNTSNYQNELKSIRKKSFIIKDELKDLKKNKSDLLDLFLEGKFDKDILYKREQQINKRISNLEIELKANEDELKSKVEYRKQQVSARNSLRRIKEDIHILKQTLKDVINKVVLFPVKENLIEGIFKNKQDKLVYVEVFTFLKEEPLSFIISQRSNHLIMINEKVLFDKENNRLYKNNDDDLIEIQELSILDNKKTFGVEEI
jgi:DNA invertase Pin-like site-specific DNA recombinase